MNAFTRGTIAAAQAEIRRCVAQLETARRGGCELNMLAHCLHTAQLRAESAERELDRALRLDDQTGDAA